MMLSRKINALLVLGLLANACGDNSQGSKPPVSSGNIPTARAIDGKSPVPSKAPVVPEAQAPQPAGDSPAAPAAKPVAEESKPIVEAPKETLPAARALTAAEKSKYLDTQTPYLNPINVFARSVGAGYDSVTDADKVDCMTANKDFRSSRVGYWPDFEFVIAPLSSVQQQQAILGFDSGVLDLGSFRLDDITSTKKLQLVAITKRIRKLTSDESMVKNDFAKSLSAADFNDRCGDSYLSGYLWGFYTLSTLEIPLDGVNTKEAVLSRLIDTGSLGKFSDLATFQSKLSRLLTLIRQTPELNSFAYASASKSLPGMTIPSDPFNLGADYQAWYNAVNKVPESDLPTVGAVYTRY